MSFDPSRRLCGGSEDPFAYLEQYPVEKRVPGPADDLPLTGGWIGYLAYEAGRFVERLPSQAEGDLDLPFASFGFYDTLAIFDHLTEEWTVAGLDRPDPGRPGLVERLDSMEVFLNEAADRVPPEPIVSHGELLDDGGGAAVFHQGVRRILEHIRAGDIYQANLSQRLTVSVRHHPAEIYRVLRRTNPAGYMAYLDCGDHHVLCSSPELFLHLRNGELLTRPIKGTRPRRTDPSEDAAEYAALRESPKDLAELAMIVDLQRNDLGRVCESVRTTWPPVVETYPTVHHLVADVRGRLGHPPSSTASGWAPHARGAVDVLRATFPGGSITGAPKIRAMEIIDQLEPVARGPYCGSIGFIGVDGNMTLNIAIRTMTIKNGRAYVHSGSGIVADSDPAAEFAEIQAKARGLLAALGVPWSASTGVGP